MSLFRTSAVFVSLLATGAIGLLACPGAQLKSGGGEGGVEIVLRRVDVVKAAYDKIEVNVVVAVNNDTDSAVDIEASADLALVGPADKDANDDDAAEGEAEAAEEAPAEVEAVSGLDGARHAGTGRGSAAANNTSELPIRITLPLPADPTVLEQVLSWKKAKLHIKGKVKAGFTEQTISGTRDVATPQLPELKLKSAQIAKLNDNTAGEAFFTLMLDNKNPFEVVVDRLTWKIMINGKELKSKDDGSTSVPASAVEEYNESVEVSEKAFPAKDLKALLKAPSVPYSITASFEVRGIHHDVEFKGDMQFPR